MTAFVPMTVGEKDRKCSNNSTDRLVAISRPTCEISSQTHKRTAPHIPIHHPPAAESYCVLETERSAAVFDGLMPYMA